MRLQGPVRVLVLLVVGCAAHHLAPAEWHDQPPAAPCEVQIVDTDGMGDFARVERYDAGGHLVFGTTRLTYDGHGFEQLRWQGGRIAAVDSFYEQDARRGDCDSSCDEPATREIDHTTYSYRDDQLVEEARETRSYKHPAAWTLDHDHSGANHFDYAGARLIAVSTELGDVPSSRQLDYDGEHVVRLRFHTHTMSGEDRFEWQGDRLAVYRWSGYVQTFAYDAGGRLVREVLSGHDDTKTTEWTYDDASRVTTMMTAMSYRGSAALDRHVWRYSYDADGRLVHTERDAGGQTRAYVGACAKELAHPNPPTALRRAGVTTCVRTPGYLYDTCS